MQKSSGSLIKRHYNPEWEERYVRITGNNMFHQILRTAADKEDRTKSNSTKSATLLEQYKTHIR